MMKKAWKSFVQIVKEGDYTKREAVLFGVSVMLAGILIGMFVSPKKRVMIGSNNGNNNNGTFDGLDFDEDDEEDEDE